MTALTDALVRATSALVSDHDLTDLLATLLSDGQASLGCAAAGLLVRSPDGDLEVLTATSHRSQELEAYQAQQLEGPCVDAVSSGEVVFASGLELLTRRWPGLRDPLQAAGFQAVQTHPMRWHTEVLGAVNFFFDEPVEEDAVRVTAGQAFADMATLILLTPRDLTDHDLVAQIDRALTERIVVEQAKGVLAHTLDVEMAEAYEVIRTRALSMGTSLSAAAQQIVTQAWST
jgi:GAF domain-containing protein